MTDITKTGSVNSGGLQVNGPSLATEQPPTNTNRAGLLAGEAIKQGDACCILAADGLVYRSIATLNAAPLAPVCTNTADGTGLWNGQALLVTATFVTAQGESTPSIPTLFKITTTGQLHIATTGYTGLDASIVSMNFYVNGILFANGTVTATNLAAALDISGATPTLAGRTAPLVNMAYKNAKWQVDGFAATQASVGDAITLYHDVLMHYASGMTPGASLYVSSTAGLLATTNTGTLTPAAEVFDATRIWIRRVKV